MTAAHTRTVTDLILGVADAQAQGLYFEDRFLPWSDHVRASERRAAVLEDLLDANEPPHFGVLMDNVPEFSLLAGAAALSGTVLVGLNTTRRGAALARDVEIAKCQVIFTERGRSGLLKGLGLDVPVIDVDSESWAALLAGERPEFTPRTVAPNDLFMLIFTSGTSGDPKAVRCTHAKIADPGIMLAERFGLSPDDVVYMSMPLFHSNAMMAAWSVALAGHSSIALRRKFSASNFLIDVRRYGVTYANYVGKPLAYVLATPELPDDVDNTLRLMYGNEGSAPAVAAFSRRFGTAVIDGFGSTEGGIAISATPGAPPGALGRLPDGISILNGETGQPCPPAEFDYSGRLVNADAATGELVNTTGLGAFAGYYNDPAADAERIRGGMYWSGDLAYRDADGFVYFAGRSSGWLRVDGENIGSAIIERILQRYDGFAQVSVYAVPDAEVGDRVMAAIVPTRGFDPIAFADFLDAQSDLGPKQRPSLIRVCTELPRTATFKVLTRVLSAEADNCGDPVWVRDGALYSPL
ncbi:long-chain-fatty-acid--CoA ligase [Rhodococcus marinonascens]|uniref:long-chain-fatty-acid--CoA ligase n=1 Tax=Rhodococcus marinonascens TaxID=38311 RepID=UPI0009330988|nr:long-chain-fatty-acid--CoA ligase [Rhodococcus marinonascens]